MRDYDDRLKELNDNRLQLKQLEDRLEQLEVRRRELAIREYELRQALREEQADVDRLEGFTLASLLNTLAGKKKEKLTREQEEAYQAGLRHADAEKELACVKAEILKHRREADALQYNRAEYEKLLAEKTAVVRS